MFLFYFIKCRSLLESDVMSTAIRDAHDKNFTFTGAYSMDDKSEEKVEKVEEKCDKNNKKIFRIVEKRI